MKRVCRVICVPLLLGMTAIMAPTVTWSEPGPMRMNMPSFADFDLNGDGFVEEQEFDEARAKRISERASQGYPMRNAGNAPPFSAIDSDGDGRVSPQEFSAHQAQHRRQMMPR